MHCSFYSFFTKYSILENYGFVSGLWSKLTRKFLPEIADEGKFEFLVEQSRSVDGDLSSVHQLLTSWLVDPEGKANIYRDLHAAISALSTKVIAFGLDHKLQDKFSILGIDVSSYLRLIHELDALVQTGQSALPAFRQSLEEASQTILRLRQHKDQVGTSLHLTVTTQRMLEYIDRIKQLLDLEVDIADLSSWDALIREHREYEASKNSIRRYLKSHADLLALVIVQHTSQKGEQYVAENIEEYKDFFKKGAIGGLFISIFALGKIYLDANLADPLPSALLFSLNYALCFVLVKVIGGTIATKQPAMTASTIIKYIDKNNTMRIGARQDIIGLLRKVSRSQFISLMGNFLVAFSMACLLAYLLSFGLVTNPIDADKSGYLLKSVSLFSGGAIYYAAIAGLFLSLSGFLSGYVDNRVIAAKLPLRLRHHRLLVKWAGAAQSARIASYTERKLGGIAGNIGLGFMLGSAFLLSYMLPFEVDIRHVAFSSSNVGYAIVGHSVAWSVIVLALLQVLVIGFVNFLVSFSITFYITLKSRGVTAGGLTKLLLTSVKDFFWHPLDYFVFRKERPEVEVVE